MLVKIEKTFQVKYPIENVWAPLSDPKKVVVCVPGAQIVEQVDERTYKGTINVKVGPSVSDYRGDVQILKLDPQSHEIEILGRGTEVRGKGSASMKMTAKLQALPDGGTEVVSVSEINIVGILAQVGSRMINEVSNILFQQFVTNFQQQLEQMQDVTTTEGKGDAAAQPSPPKPVRALPLILSALWAAI